MPAQTAAQSSPARGTLARRAAVSLAALTGSALAGFVSACTVFYVLRARHWKCAGFYYDQPAAPDGPVNDWVCPDGNEYALPFLGTFVLVTAAVLVVVAVVLRRRRTS